MGYILITGCNGFIGNKLTNTLLEKGYKVLGLSTGENCRKEGSNFKYIRVDLTNCLAVEKIFSEHDISSVIHLAAIAHLKNRKKIDWNEFYRVNTLASKTIFQCAIRNKAEIFYASTVDVYGSNNTTILTEDCEPNPISNYAKSKYIAEKILRKIANENSYNYTIARFAPVYAKEFMKDAYKRIYLKYPTIAFKVGKGYSYQFVSANNIIDFVINWIERNKEITGTFNICDSKLINSNEFIELEQEIGNSKKTIQVPYSIVNSMKFIVDKCYSIVKLQLLNKIQMNVNKLINPSRYSISKMKAIITPKWDIENTVYHKEEMSKVD